ncbi:MAG: dihydrodipicolinate reductase [Sulfuritalea sp.]|nr:dihydrodipicolinate reductase [Sulfuritalea sp.]
MKVGLVGFGKTGKAVASILLESSTTHLSWVLRRSKTLEHRSVPEFLGVESEEPGIILSAGEFSARGLLDAYPVDVIIDFSSADGIDYYGEEARKRGISIISAVSEYPTAALDRLKQLAKSTRVIHSPNITLGINFLLIAAKILKNIAPGTDIEIIEEHYKNKPEVSGTAKVIAKHLDIKENTIKTVRAGGIIGTHEILFGFPYQTVRLKHESISREAFGNGILFALNHLPSRRTGLYTMEDLLIPYFSLCKSEAEFTRSQTRPWWKIW